MLSAAELVTVLDALAVAANAKRDAAEKCVSCDGRPDSGNLCGSCAVRFARADDYDTVAEQIRSQL